MRRVTAAAPAARMPMARPMGRGAFLRGVGAAAVAGAASFSGVRPVRAQTSYVQDPNGNRSLLIVSPSNDTTGVTDRSSIQWAFDNVVSGGTVKLAGGQYYLTANVPNGAVVQLLNKSATVEASDALNPPVLNVKNTAFTDFYNHFPSGPSMPGGFYIVAPGCAVTLNSLVYRGNCSVGVFGSNLLTIYGCDIDIDIMSRDMGLVIRPYQSAHDITGSVVVDSSTIKGTFFGMDLPSGPYGTDADFTIQNCHIENTIYMGPGRSKTPWGHAFETGGEGRHYGRFFINQNHFVGSAVVTLLNHAGSVIMVDNDVTSVGYIGAYSKMFSYGIQVLETAETGSVMLNDNRIHLNAPAPSLLFGLFPQFVIPVWSGLQPSMQGNRNTEFRNISIDGSCMEYVSHYVWAYDSNNCTFQNIQRTSPTIGWTWWVLPFIGYPPAPYPSYTPIDYIMDGCTGCTIIDNVQPYASILDNTGTTTLLGVLQKVYNTQGNAAPQLTQEQLNSLEPLRNMNWKNVKKTKVGF